MLKVKQHNMKSTKTRIWSPSPAMMIALPIWTFFGFDSIPEPDPWILRHAQSPEIKITVVQRGDIRENCSPWTALTTREYIMYCDTAKRTGGRSRKMACMRYGANSPVE
jgi:hypothetical protein